ncbi:MAG: DUF1592 domain-containing protein [Bradymonadia bacterium]
MQIFDAHRWKRALTVAALCACAACDGEMSSPQNPIVPDMGVGPVGGTGGVEDPGPVGGAGGDGAGGEMMPPTGGMGGGEMLPPFEAAPSRMFRLTMQQYRNSLRDVFGADLALPDDLEADTPLHGFSVIGGGELTVSPRAAEQYEVAARYVAAQLFGDGQGPALTGCDTPEPECLSVFFAHHGRLLWRRPLTEAELQDLLDVVDQAGNLLQDPWAGVQMTVSAMLQAPDFLFRVELGTEVAEGRALDDFELAAKLAWFLWQSAPDDALLDAAAEGTLSSPEGLRAEAERMLDDPKAERGLLGFFAEAFTLDRLAFIDKDRTLFPQMTDTLGQSMRREVEALIKWLVVDADVDVRELLTTRRVFVDGPLAALYGLPAPERPGQFEAMILPGNHPRGGLLGTGAFLAMNAHATVTSPTLRGKFVQNHLLCFDIPPPPPGVNTSLEPDPDGAPPTTTRAKLERHREDPTCASCHVYMDPIGLALENYDAIGAWRTIEAETPIDASGNLDGEDFLGGRQLSALIAGRDDFTECQVRRLYRYAQGHLEGPGEALALAELGEAFVESGYRVRSLALALVTHPSFRAVGAPEEGPPEEGMPEEEAPE